MREPPSLSLRRFSFIFVVLALLYGLVDGIVAGPVYAAVGDWLVVEPVETAWGFHAEWRQASGVFRNFELMTIISVVPDGPFARAGIRPGMAFPPILCGLGQPVLGGRHALLAGGEVRMQVQLIKNFAELNPGESFRISR